MWGVIKAKFFLMLFFINVGGLAMGMNIPEKDDPEEKPLPSSSLIVVKRQSLTEENPSFLVQFVPQVQRTEKHYIVGNSFVRRMAQSYDDLNRDIQANALVTYIDTGLFKRMIPSEEFLLYHVYLLPVSQHDIKSKEEYFGPLSLPIILSQKIEKYHRIPKTEARFLPKRKTSLFNLCRTSWFFFSIFLCFRGL